MIALCHPNRKHYGKNLCQSCYQYKWRDSDNYKLMKRRGIINSLTIKKRYGITLEERELLKAKQNYRCAICSEQKRLYIDHKHGTKNVRGMLCPRCNTLCGFLENDKGEIQKAREYLLKHEPSLIH